MIQKQLCSRRAFTLIELLITMAIMIVLLGLVAPSVAPLIRSSNLNKAASMITDELNKARQLALTQNKDVEVRFYKLPSKTSPSDLQYRAFRCFAATTNNSTRSPLSPVRYLPEPIIFATDPDKSGNIVSTILDIGNTSRSGLTSGSESIPSAASATYISFLYRPTGGTSLAPVDTSTGNWYLTLYAENMPKTPDTGIPANYFTAQIDPVTGHVRTYRP